MWRAKVAGDFLGPLPPRPLMSLYIGTATYACSLSCVVPGCISTSLHQSVRARRRVSLWKCLCVWTCIFATATSLPPSLARSFPLTAVNTLSLSTLLPPSLSLSLIYIAMTPVSVMLAPCCEFHLSRKTSGDCYANGYVVGLVQECVYVCVCWEGGGTK